VHLRGSWRFGYSTAGGGRRTPDAALAAAVADDEAEQQQDCYLHISEFGDGLVANDGVLPKDLGSRFLVLMDAAKRSIRRQCPVGGPVGTEDSSREDHLPPGPALPGRTASVTCSATGPSPT
jgi:hypothetical protein